MGLFRRQAAVLVRVHLRPGPCSRFSTGWRKFPPLPNQRASRRFRQSGPIGRKSTAIGSSVLPATAFSISRRCKIGCCSGDFRAVSGPFIDVIGWGGKTKTFELEVDFQQADCLRPSRCRSCCRPLKQQQHQCRRQIPSISARQAAVVRGPWGLIRSADELSNTMLTPERGEIRCWCGDVAAVHVGHKPRSRHRRQGRPTTILSRAIVLNAPRASRACRRSSEVRGAKVEAESTIRTFCRRGVRIEAHL